MCQAPDTFGGLGSYHRTTRACASTSTRGSARWSTKTKTTQGRRRRERKKKRKKRKKKRKERKKEKQKRQPSGSPSCSIFATKLPLANDDVPEHTPTPWPPTGTPGED